MSTLSRRAFFVGKYIGKPAKIVKSENPEVMVGKIADFPVGEKKLLEKFQLVMESFSEGLRARANSNDNSNENNNKNKFFAIKVNQSGELVVNRSEYWLETQVFSILTYGPTSFDTLQEDRS